MAINVSQAFKRTSANPVDETLALTKAEMLAINDNLMPSKYLTICQDDGYIYLYDKSAIPNQTTGKFTKFEGGGGANALNDLTDVTISSAAQNQILKYNGSGWVNSAVPEDTTKYGTSDSASTDLADADYIPFYDSSASAKKKTLWSNIKTVLANTFQPKLTAGNNITITDNTISASAGAVGVWSKSDIYSTTEKVVGCWTDGRPIYQRTFTSTMPTRTEKTKDIAVLGTTICVKNFEAFYVATDNASVQLPVTTTTASGYDFNMYCAVYYYLGKLTVVNYATVNYYDSLPLYITIRYTKTTDAANSYNYADENDYSTSEKVIGKWIDGSNLYQRVVTFGAIGTGGSVTVNHGISSASKWIDARGTYTLQSGATGLIPNGVGSGEIYNVLISGFDSTKITMNIGSGYTDTNAIASGYVIVKYTK